MNVRSDRAIAVVLVLALAIGLWVLRPASTDQGPPYQLSGRGPSGLSGLDAGLRSAGVAVHDRSQPTLAGDGLTVTVEPSGVTHDEAAAWVAQLRAGATMVYASDTADPFTRALGLRYVEGGNVSHTAAAQTFPGSHVPTRVGRAIEVPRAATTIYAAGGGSAFAIVPVGRGAVWLFSDPSWLTNEHVATTALPIVLPLAWSAGRAASFDRYHQSGAGHLDALAYLPPVATLLAIEAALAVLLLVAALLRRPGPVWPDGANAADDDVTLAPSLAALYARGHHVGTVTRALADASERRMGSRAPAAAGQLQRLRDATDADEAVEAWRELEQVERR